MPSLQQPIEALVGPLRFSADGFADNFARRELGRGDYWLREGEVCRKLAFAESGGLRHYRCYDDRQLTRWAALPGQYATAMSSFTTGEPSEDNVVATGARLRAEHPRLQESWVKPLEYTLACFEDRVWSPITGDAETRYRYMIERYPESPLRLPQHFVADTPGIAPRYLSRIRAKMAGVD